MEEITVEPCITSQVSTLAEGSTVTDQSDARKAGRFSRKKDKKKAVKKTKKSAKHSKEKDQAQGTSTAEVDISSFRRSSIEDLLRNEQDDYQGVQNDPKRGTSVPDLRGAATSDPARRDSGIEDESSRPPAGIDHGVAAAAGSHIEKANTLPGRFKSRSRSGSRKKFSSFFRRRRRSSAREDRSKSDTDISGMTEERKTRRDKISARNASAAAHSLDRTKGRHSTSVDRDSARHSESVERESYQRYDATKRPRDRLLNMTVKDAVIEYRHRRHASANRLSSAERQKEENRHNRSASDTDVSQVGGSRERVLQEAGSQLDPEDITLVKTVANFSKNRQTLLEMASPLSTDVESLGVFIDHSPNETRHAEGKKNLGQQIMAICKTINKTSDGEVCDIEDKKDKIWEPSNTVEGQVQRDGRELPRNRNSVIFIDPNDIIESPITDSSANFLASHDKLATIAQTKIKPSDQFMELRKAVPLYSNSTAARERRISQSNDAFQLPSDRKSSESFDPFKLYAVPSISPKSVTGQSFQNIPNSEFSDKNESNSFSPNMALSPTITVNRDPSMSKSFPVERSVTMDTSMVSSTDSGKPSSDPGFFSELRDSDSESGEDLSGFSTPPEEPDSVRDLRGSSLSPTVLVNTVSNLLEVPRSKNAYSRSVSDGARHTEVADAPSEPSPFNRSESSKSDSVLLKKREVQPAASSELEGRELYRQHKENLNRSTDSAIKAKEKRVEQKTVPVMGTSVQKKYRRTFSPDRNKETQSPQDGSISPADSFKEARSTLESPENDKPFQAQQGATGNQLNVEEVLKEFDEGKAKEGKLHRGRDTHKRKGYISIRSFRRRKEKNDNKKLGESGNVAEPEISLTGDLIDDGTEEYQHRKSFQDKSIQTSDSLLNDLIKKSKKRKLGLFSTNGKKPKQEQPEKVIEIPVGIPPPQYEEQRLIAQEETVDAIAARGCPGVPFNPAVGVSNRNTEQVPDYHHVETENEEPAVDPPQQETADAPKRALKSKGPSLRAIVTLKQRLARNRKKKEVAKSKQSKVGEDENEDKVEDDLPSDTFIFIENEINLSKLAEIKETDILDVEIIEPNFDIVFPKKQLRFEPIASDEPIQSEEPLPPLSPASRRLTARRNSTRGRERRKKCLHCCKKFVAFLFSHIGLCSLVVGYTIMGGFVFKALEGPHEMKVKREILKKRLDLMNHIESLATDFQMNEQGRVDFNVSLGKKLMEYQKYIHEETTKGWDGNEYEEDSQIEQWSYASSLLYAITVMTTIGYGHVAPKTPHGRVVTIAYAVLGIPLTLLCLTNIGDVMASGFRLLYGKVCCGLCCKLFKPSRRRRRRIPDVEKGLGRQVVTTEKGETDKPKEVIQVPTSLCILLIAAYIFAGSLLFALWEQWDFLTGAYFCFITLSTIGFGDIVPGMDIHAWSKESKLVLSALYLIFGLSLIAMCFNLVQEDVKAKCRWLGMKIGIIDKPEPPV